MLKVNFLLLIIFLFSKLISGTVSGFVSNASNGEPLAYVAVFLQGTNLGSITNEKGYYVINHVPTGEVVLSAQQIGFSLYSQKLKVESVSHELYQNIELSRENVKTEGIKVEEKRYDEEVNTREIRISKVIRTTEDLKNVSQIAEPDVFRAIQVQPGVTPISDFSSGLYVRGGSPDQNLILIDGIDVYNPTHFGGVFSTFNTDAVKNVELLKGGFPARYGGRLSSVLNITNKDGNRKHPEGIARISLLSSSGTLEGPWRLGKLKGSYMFSGRRTYLELVKKALSLDIPDYYFYDGHAKINLDLSQQDKFSFSTYLGKDKLKMEDGIDLGISWGNETFSSQWTHIFNPQLFSHFIFAGSHYGSLMKQESDADEYWERANDIWDLSVKAYMSYQPVDSHILDYGFDLKFNKITFSSESNADIDDTHMPNIEVSSRILAAYLQDSWALNYSWTFEPGLRLTYASSKSEYRDGEPTSSYGRISPRLALRRKLTDNSNIYGSFGIYHQYLSLLSYEEFSPMDLWFPLDETVQPGKSVHYIIGYKSEISNQLGIEIETYYKDYENLVEYRMETDYEWNNETGTLSDVLNIGPGFSYGTDILLRTDLHGFEGFIGYGFSVTRRKIDSQNINPDTGKEQYYYPKYDRTHQINIVENFNFTKASGKDFLGADWSLGFTFSYASGQPYAKPEHAYFDGDYIKFIYSYKDRYRLPDYLRLDVSASFRWDFSGWSLEPFIQVINITGHENIWNRAYTAPIDEQGNITIKEHDTTMFPLIPFLGFNIEW